MAKMKIIDYGFVGDDRTKVRIYTADGGVIEARRCPLPERLTCSGSKPALYCTRDGHFLSLTKLGLREIKPNLAQAGSRKCTHTNGNGTHYPFLRQFGAKHCHFLVAGAWYGPRPEGMVIDHLNGDILDWSADNLEYVTPEENRKRENCTEAFTDEQMQHITQIMTLTDTSLSNMENLLEQDSPLTEDQTAYSHDLENEINNYRNELKSRNLQDIDAGRYSYQLGVFYVDFICECERLADYVINIVETNE